MSNLSRNSPWDKCLGKALIGALPIDAGFLEFVPSSEFRLVQTKFAFATIFCPARFAISTTSHSVPLAGVAFAAPSIIVKNVEDK
jgi:hypothetical protein